VQKSPGLQGSVKRGNGGREGLIICTNKNKNKKQNRGGYDGRRYSKQIRTVKIYQNDKHGSVRGGGRSRRG